MKEKKIKDGKHLRKKLLLNFFKCMKNKNPFFKNFNLNPFELYMYHLIFGPRNKNLGLPKLLHKK